MIDTSELGDVVFKIESSDYENCADISAEWIKPRKGLSGKEEIRMLFGRLKTQDLFNLKRELQSFTDQLPIV